MLLRLAEQWDLLRTSALAELSGEPEEPSTDPRDRPRVSLPIASNADSLAIWLLPVIAEMRRQHPVSIEVLREQAGRNTGSCAPVAWWGR